MIARLPRMLLAIAVGVVLDLLDALAYFASIAVSTAILVIVLPLPVAFAVSLLAVSVVHGYRIARRIERARERGEER
ncbi:hypothetical protein [Spongiactinospora sp. TRM90649]|uniref:hypothetical protein n=1 Tax=Spongiactinospora sp. TRM90649 TaxID=3031114 RepID=UPI0023F818DF|nr:hypothetical protein [Spongiactinospora sp. TRM90649]MDF5759184.1 hypothetical protein [Spongiactinospora sp. TRM90649]